MSGARLPEGTVTFLLTDVEGSTRLWDEHPTAMALALARHDALVTDAVAAHGGHLLKTRGEGDSTFSVFAQPSDALAAVVELQLAVAGEDWPDGLQLPVRAAVHTGEAELRDGDYFGGTVNRAARLRSLGHGGQILLSDATAELAAGAVPAGGSIRDLGVFELKGLTRPERVHQLCHPDLRAEFAPLVGDARRDSNLPAQLTGFIGRQDDLSQLRKLLEERRMVTVTGPGGSGKTRLTIEVAAEWVNRVRDGVWLVELASVADPALVAGSIAAALGIREQPGQPLVDTIVAEARGREQLLVVDNCEHLVDACADVLETLLRECADLKVLASSRQPVGVRGEDTFALPPLGLPPESVEVTAQSVNEYDATRLFLERASLTHAQLQPEDAGAIATICRRLDGIPLAIELAAARTSVLTPAQIATRLDDRFGLLESVARNVEPRQRTLRGAIDWSHELLDESERALFRRLSVFAGSATLDAVEDVCRDGIDVLDALSQLVDKSLVIHERGRYRMLESIRAYARSQLRQSADLTPTNQRFLDYACRLAKEAQGSVRDLDDDIDNLRAALTWAAEAADRAAMPALALELVDFWRTRGHWAEGLSWLTQASSRSGLSSRARSSCAAHGSDLARLRGDFAVALELAEQAAELAEDDDQRTSGLMAAANARHASGDLDGAMQRWEQAAALQRRRESPSGLLPSILGNMGVGAHSNGRPGRARLHYEEALATGATGRVAEVLRVNLGNVLIDLGEYAEAEKVLERALVAARDRGDVRDIAEALRNLGKVAAATDRPELAASRLEESLEVSRRLDDLMAISATLVNLSQLHRFTGDTSSARAMAEEALDLVVRAGNVLMSGIRRLTLVEVELASGQAERAADQLREALAGPAFRDWKVLSAEGVRAAGLTAAALGRSELAARLLGAFVAAIEQTESVPFPSEQRQLDKAIASVRMSLGDSEFDRAWNEGRALALEDALVLAGEV